MAPIVNFKSPPAIATSMLIDDLLNGFAHVELFLDRYSC
jgi:hypothetical protein